MLEILVGLWDCGLGIRTQYDTVAYRGAPFDVWPELR